MKAGERSSRFLARRLFSAVPLLLGVTLISFTLTVHFGPDPAWEQLGRNPTPEQIQQVRHTMGQDRPFPLRYAGYLVNLARLDLGHSYASGEPVLDILLRTVPVSLLLVAPGFLLGIVLALVLALAAAWRPHGHLDRFCDLASATGMSLSLVIIVIALQAVFGVWLDWFPVRGWRLDGPVDYLEHAAVPTMALIAANMGYNLRFFRAVFRDVLADPPVRTARAYGFRARRIATGYVLRAAAPPILTRVMVAIPLIVISGSLIIESHFGIPGVGLVTWNAVMSGDQPVLMAVVSFSSILFVLALTATDLLTGLLDPRSRSA
ncbi:MULTISPECIES: ABC transporter permease [unclassified Wenzhouxiangella]|uniref:ABC transporter permease n=1 Tax=unclassified Wenzhouxiangella TaxID=2613841 RepID=UPI000E32AFE2|nr:MULTISPECIES: ABC transporter permease [unclassified Wenzhouxiangella]RFF28178.1 ABC transporter permease [Wenzhouxiangella sp. 15181]RFP67955.1 ABC transporter permease [Wenzhouxiangella sp. 15190]